MTLIPKKLHYCWFGGELMPPEVRKYLAGWQAMCPDYEICEWDETNFDVMENAYCREAYEAKKWAFVADYARLKILYDEGGIYMDTDVEVLRPFDDLLDYEAFMCFENPQAVSIGTLGAQAGSTLLRKLLAIYENRHFQQSDGSWDMTTNLRLVTPVLVKNYGLVLSGERQILNDRVVVLPSSAFIAKNYSTGAVLTDSTTYAIHHYMESWVDLPADQAELLKWQRIYARDYLRVCIWWATKLGVIKAVIKLGGMSGLLMKIRSFVMKRLSMYIRGGQTLNSGRHFVRVTVHPDTFVLGGAVA